MPKYDALREYETAAPNFDLTTDDIIDVLTRWDDIYGIELSHVDENHITVYFLNLPEDLDVLLDEICEFCPDIIAQGFNCFEEILEQAEEEAPEIAESMKLLAEGIDFNDPDFDMQLFRKSILQDRTVQFWWD